MKKLTHEEFIEKFKSLNPNYSNIEVMDEYKGTKIKLKCKCLIHNYIWEAKPENLFMGKGCPLCGKEKSTISRTKPKESFFEKLQKINNNIELLSDYSNLSTKVKCRCLIDNNIWFASPEKLLQGKGCPVCGRQRTINSARYTTEAFVEKLKQINPYIKILGEYTNSKTPIECLCVKHNHTWFIRPSDLLRGKSCKFCGIEKLSSSKLKSSELFLKEMLDLNPNIKIESQYINSQTKIKCFCELCGNIWEAIPNNLLKQRGCPKCFSSNGEKKIEQFLIKNNIEYIREFVFKDCADIQPLRFDFYLPKHNLCIEYDGEQHFKPVNFGGCDDTQAKKSFVKTVKHDAIKNNYCTKHGIDLIRIDYKNFKNIENILYKKILHTFN